MKEEIQKTFTLYVENADGPNQINLMNNETDLGRRILGSKGSPYKKCLAKFNLTKDELQKFVDEIQNQLHESNK